MVVKVRGVTHRAVHSLTSNGPPYITGPVLSMKSMSLVLYSKRDKCSVNLQKHKVIHNLLDNHFYSIDYSFPVTAGKAKNNR